MARTSKSVVIVGGGISGLSAAFALLEQAEASAVPITCTVLEAAPVWGGKILTHRVGERVMEAGPDSFLSKKPWGMDLCRRLGLTDRLIGTKLATMAFGDSTAKKRSVVDDAQLARALDLINRGQTQKDLLEMAARN